MQTDSQESPEPPQRKPNSPERITHDRVLLVEGQDEVKFFEMLLLHTDLHEQIQVIEVGGKDRFIFILPGNQQTGMLESLCLQTVTDHPVMICVESFMNCLREHLETKPEGDVKIRSKPYFPKNTEKARLLAFLAGLHESMTSVGVAAQKGYWPFDHEALSDLRDFLKTLVE